MELRNYKPEDCKYLAELFYDTVHFVNVKDYTVEQLNVWATGSVDLEKWNEEFLEHYTIVAVCDERIVGFGDMAKTGYLDRLYVHKDYQKQGVATAICDELEVMVDAEKYVTHASITAKPFLEKRGYKVIKEQQVERQGVAYELYYGEERKKRMKKVFIVTTIVLMIIAIVLYVCFRKFLKTHAEEEVGQHEKVLYAYLIGMIGVSILTGLSGIMLCLLE